jgi:radical SAM protein with 4Fe4S-binding SPASM domain
LQPYAVEISLYGADAATHDAVTQLPGSFARTRCAFGLLAAQGVRTVLKTPLLAGNIAQLDALRALAAELHADFRCDPLLTPKRSGDDAPLRCAPRFAELVHHYRRTLDAAPPLSAPGCRLCNIGHNALAIAPNGDVYPCLELPIAVGNVRHTPLADIWKQAPLWETLTSLRAETLAVCGDCALGALCGRCHGLARHATGDQRAPSPLNCMQALARRQALIERKLASPESLPLNAHLAALHQRLDSGAAYLPA